MSILQRSDLGLGTHALIVSRLDYNTVLCRDQDLKDFEEMWLAHKVSVAILVQYRTILKSALDIGLFLAQFKILVMSLENNMALV